MGTEIESYERLDIMDKVVQQMLKGSSNRQISKSLGLKVSEVDGYIGEWQTYARNNQYIQDRAKDALMATDEHYDLIVRGLWQVVDSADVDHDNKLKASTLKSIADVERQRIEMLQKSGLLENQQIADQIISMEKKHEIIIGILRQVVEKYPEAAEFIKKEISKVTGEVYGKVVD